VCKRWHRFENFYADMGNPTSMKHSIHRKDNDKGYSKRNCTWATPVTQARSRTNTMYLTINNATKSVLEWSLISGVPKGRIWSRVHRGNWSHYDAVFTPVNVNLSRRH
jgi:hypothetical protein